MAENWFAFRAFTTQTQYGYGTEQEAEKYAERLNRNRYINVYASYAVTDEVVKALNLDNSDLGFALSTALSDVED